MNTLRTLREISTFTHEILHEHSARRRGRFIVPVSLHNQKRVYSLSSTHIHIIKYIHSFHHTRISVPHFVGIYGYVGPINLPLRLLVGCEQGNEHSVENLCSLTKWVANILLYHLFSIVILFVWC